MKITLHPLRKSAIHNFVFEQPTLKECTACYYIRMWWCRK